MAEVKVNAATEAARKSGAITEDSQLNPADVGQFDNQGREVKPFDHKKGVPGDGLTKGMELNPADSGKSEASAAVTEAEKPAAAAGGKKKSGKKKAAANGK